LISVFYLKINANVLLVGYGRAKYSNYFRIITNFPNTKPTSN
jgi:hypothetical protein